MGHYLQCAMGRMLVDFHMRDTGSYEILAQRPLNDTEQRAAARAGHQFKPFQVTPIEIEIEQEYEREFTN